MVCWEPDCSVVTVAVLLNIISEFLITVQSIGFSNKKIVGPTINMSQSISLCNWSCIICPNVRGLFQQVWGYTVHFSMNYNQNHFFFLHFLSSNKICEEFMYYIKQVSQIRYFSECFSWLVCHGLTSYSAIFQLYSE